MFAFSPLSYQLSDSVSQSLRPDSMVSRIPGTSERSEAVTGSRRTTENDHVLGTLYDQSKAARIARWRVSKVVLAGT